MRKINNALASNLTSEDSEPRLMESKMKKVLINVNFFAVFVFYYTPLEQRVSLNNRESL